MQPRRKPSYTETRDDNQDRYIKRLAKYTRVEHGKGKPSRNRRLARVGKCHPDFL